MPVRFLLCVTVTLNVLFFLVTNGLSKIPCMDSKGLNFGASLRAKRGELNVNRLNVPNDGIYPEFLSTVKQNYLHQYEGPIAHRLILLSTSVVFSSMAAFDEKSLDFFARFDESRERRRCDVLYVNADKDEVSLYRRVTLAYSLYFALTTFMPESREKLTEIMVNYKLPSDICDKLHFDCDDLRTPWGLSLKLVKEVSSYGEYDGFNADGSLSREYNKIPYQDFRGENRYIPKNDPWNLRLIKYWQPLLESDGKGFLFNQEHVTPHVGYTAKSFFLGDDDICSRKAAAPRYNYLIEMKRTLSKMAGLTDNDKMEIELFDNKVASIVAMVGDYYLQIGESLDSFKYISADVMILSTLYECVLVAWKEKVRFNAVRPPSIVHEWFGNKIVKSYAGRSADGKSYGTQNLKGNEWEPYIRTMPHAEYPSGSACLCSAYASALQHHTGKDDFTLESGPITRSYAPKSSVLEPLSTPKRYINFSFKKWSEIYKRCGESRLNGGMHFSKAVPAGSKLCQSIGTIVSTAFNKITHGDVPDYVVDINDKTIPNRQCHNH